jgi:propionate CoA-transferase
MDSRIFREGVMGLRAKSSIALEYRFHYDPDENVAYVNLEGMALESPVEVEALAGYLDERFAAVGRPVHVVINYDDLVLEPAAAEAFAAMVLRNSRRSAASWSRETFDGVPTPSP